MLIMEISALESAIATLEGLFQSIEFVNEEQASAVRARLHRAEERLIVLGYQAYFGHPSGDDWTTDPLEHASDQR
jgi:hypothetical protein